MRFPLRITYLDGSAVEVVTSAADSVRFETKFDRSIVTITSDARYTDMIWLAWSACNRTKQTDLEFDAWIDTVDEVTVGEGSSDVPPLEKTAPTG
jgi:hypothetical protein